jgi:hypothetical protein
LKRIGLCNPENGYKIRIELEYSETADAVKDRLEDELAGAILYSPQGAGDEQDGIANRPELTQPAVSIAKRRGEEIAKQKGYSLFNK